VYPQVALADTFSKLFCSESYGVRNSASILVFFLQNLFD
jgi:hypothetical protein